jgi:hypothetical protein
MMLWRIGLVFGCAATLAACASRPAPAPAPTPPPLAPTPIRTPPPPPPPPPAPAPAAWQDAPLAPGEWSFDNGGGVSVASYGPPGLPSFVVRCEPGRQISLTRTGPSAAPSLAVRTSTAARTLPGRPAATGGTVALLPASDPLLDAIVFSRGRFAVEAPGQGMLIVPTWPEAARVVEDCRS